MPVPSTLQELKDAILARSLEDGMCESLQDILDASDYETVVQAGLCYIRFAIQSGIMDADLIAGIDEDILNNAGIYSTGTPSITNPDKEIYLLNDVEATINIDSTGKYCINALMQSKAEISASNQAFLRVRAFDDSEINLTQADNILSHLHVTNNVNLEAEILNDAACNVIAESASQLNITTEDSSYTALKMYGNSHADCVQNGGTLIINNFDSSTSTNVSP